MKYANSFTLNVTQSECFITFQQGIPNGDKKVVENVEGIILSERVARQLAAAINDIYGKIDIRRENYHKVQQQENGDDSGKKLS